MRGNQTILVVDDHPPTLYAVSRFLRAAGFRVMEANSGEHALLLAEQASALLVDVHLPDLNGVAVCQAVKRHSPKPVVLTSTVFIDQTHRMAGMDAGADLYLVPPIIGPELAGAFDRLLTAP